MRDRSDILSRHICYTCHMGQLNLRAIPDDLIRLLKVKAAENGVTLKDECLDIIRKHCGVIDGRASSDVRPNGHERPDQQRSRDGAKLPVLPNAEGEPERLHPVQSVRDQLAGQRASSVRILRPQPGSCPHGYPNTQVCRNLKGGC